MSKVVFREDINKLASENNKNKKNLTARSVHIRNQQRNGRKSITTIAGLEDDLDLDKILRYMRKIFSTNGTILHDDQKRNILQFQEYCRFDARDFLVKYSICKKTDIKVHGALY